MSGQIPQGVARTFSFLGRNCAVPRASSASVLEAKVDPDPTLTMVTVMSVVMVVAGVMPVAVVKG